MKKINNKGFSLVELIVVIAIMAVLIGVLAPQFIQYVAKSRVSTDLQNIEEMITACDTYAADPMVTTPLVTGTSITLKAGDTTTIKASSTNTIELALLDAGIKSYGLKSKNWGTGDLTLTVTLTNGVPSDAVTGCATGKDILAGTYQ